MRDITQYISGCQEARDDFRGFGFALDDKAEDESEDSESMFEYLVEHAKEKEEE